MKDNVKELQVYLNGDFIPRSEATLSLFDPGLQEGMRAFEMTRTFNGKPFKLREHIDRLFRSLRCLRIDIGRSPEEIERISLEIVELSEGLRGANGDFWIRHIVFDSVYAMPSDTPIAGIYCIPPAICRMGSHLPGRGTCCHLISPTHTLGMCRS